MIIKSMIYVLTLMTIFLGVVLHQSDIENDVERNIFNFTESTFDTWNSSQWQGEKLNSTNLSMSEVFTVRMRNMVFKAVDLVGYSMFQGIRPEDRHAQLPPRGPDREGRGGEDQGIVIVKTHF